MGIRNVRGETLQRVIAILSSVAFLVQGYNQAMMNAFTTLPSFLHTVPEIDTTHTTGAQKSRNADIQGWFGTFCGLFSRFVDSHRPGHRHFRAEFCRRRIVLPWNGRSTWSSEDNAAGRFYQYRRGDHPSYHLLSGPNPGRENHHWYAINIIISACKCS